MKAANIILGAIACASVANAAAAKAPSAIENRLDEMEKTIEAQRAEIEALKAQSAAEQNQEPEVTQSDLQTIQQAVAESTAATNKFAKGWFADTKVSGRMYWDFTNIKHDSDGVDQDDTGTGFDIKRFYLGVDHKFNDMFSGNITTDFLYDSTSGATQLYIKKAYLQAKINDAFVVKAGSADLPWVPFIEELYGYRYVENTLIDRTKFGTSADWGLHASGKLADGLVEYAVAVVDGAGYKHPFRSNGMDVEGRVNVNLQNFVVGVGGYYGDLGNDLKSTPAVNDASRFDAVAAYKTDALRLGVEYFTAKNFNKANITSTTEDKADGYGAFASYKFNPQWGVFGKYEYVKPKKDTNDDLKDGYFNVGISYSPAQIVDFALVYKHDKVENGTLSTSNGTIGGLDDGKYDEIGIFSQFRF